MNKMKKILSGCAMALVAMVLVACPFLFGACGNTAAANHTPVEGDVYVGESVQWRWDTESDEYKAMTEEQRAKIEETMNKQMETAPQQAKQSKVKFTGVDTISMVNTNEDGEDESNDAYYLIKDGKIFVSSEKDFQIDDQYVTSGEIKGNTIVMVMTQSGGMIVEFTFKLSK